MQSANVNYNVLKTYQNTLQKVQTGLFVNWDKSSLLLNIVQSILANRFKTVAEKGPQLPNNSCEIVLRALQPTGANFAASKELLEQYLCLIQEPKTNVFSKKVQEIIDLDAEDEDIPCIVLDDTKDESVILIDVDSSAGNSGNREKIVSSCSTCSISPDSDKGTKMSKSSCNFDSWTALKTHHHGVKRRRDFETEEEEERIQVIEIVDDDVIVVDDSFSQPQSNTPLSQTDSSGFSQSIADLKVALTGDSATVCPVHFSKSKVLETANTTSTEIRPLHNILNTVSESKVSLASNSPKELSSFTNNCTSPMENTEEKYSGKTSSDDKTSTVILKNCMLSSSSSPSTKVSKFRYKRVAHLIQPLTQSINPSKQQSKTDSSSNIYNPNASTAEKRTGLRPIVIDGNNVALSHGKGQFSLKGIQICINYFEKRGHRQIKAFIPHYRVNKDNFDDLHKMERQGTVVLTPSRKVEGKILASYDDRYIVQYASEFGGVIISHDNYRDLLQENSSWKETIEKRLLIFTWVDDLLMFPQDPLGKNGPVLDEFLRFPDPE